MTQTLSRRERSLCISRERGKINPDTWHCREALRHCPWWRAAWCIPVSGIKAFFGFVWKMLFLM